MRRQDQFVGALMFPVLEFRIGGTPVESGLKPYKWRSTGLRTLQSECSIQYWHGIDLTSNCIAADARVGCPKAFHILRNFVQFGTGCDP
jgi:hypothetical protein